MVSIVVAVASNGAIGRNNQLLWHLPDDLRRFRQLTTGGSVIMGRKTYESIGKPLPNRQNIVISRQKNYLAEGCHVVTSLEEALANATGNVAIIGGAEIYRLALPLTERVYLTEVHAEYEGDTFFEPLSRDTWQETERVHHPADEKHKHSFDFVTFTRKANITP